MYCLRRLRWYTVILPLSAAISFLIVSCSGTRVSQCNEIIQIANGAISEAEELTEGGQTSDPQAMLQAADAMEQAAQEMETLEIQDEQLQEYQTDFITMYRETSQATRDFVEAFGKKNRSAAESALKDLQQATDPEQKLVTGINTYCNGN